MRQKLKPVHIFFINKKRIYFVFTELRLCLAQDQRYTIFVSKILKERRKPKHFFFFSVNVHQKSKNSSLTPNIKRSDQCSLDHSRSKFRDGFGLAQLTPRVSVLIRVRRSPAAQRYFVSFLNYYKF